MARFGPKKGSRQSPEHIAKRKRFGANHHGWKGDAASVEAGRSRAEHRIPLGPCTRTGCTNPKGERHHRDGDTLNNESSNIEILCRRHHMEEDGRLEKFRALGIANQPKAVAARWM